MSTPTYEEEVIVIDTGTDFTRMGLSSQAAPAMMCRTVVGKPKRRESIASADGKPQIYFGQDAFDKHSVLNLKYPVEKGIINDWDALESLWHSCFAHLRLDIESLPGLQSNNKNILYF